MPGDSMGHDDHRHHHGGDVDEPEGRCVRRLEIFGSFDSPTAGATPVPGQPHVDEPAWRKPRRNIDSEIPHHERYHERSAWRRSPRSLRRL
jgi:hypothetical protein